MKTVKHIVVIGGESTGKSTLCKALARHYQTVWVPERARSYLEERGGVYQAEDLPRMLEQQLKQTAAMARHARRWLFCDTDAEVYRVWSEHKYGFCDRSILDAVVHERPDGYLLCSPDLPWEPDPLREHPEPQWREYFFRYYLQILAEKEIPFAIIKGQQQERLLQSIQWLDTLKG